MPRRRRTRKTRPYVPIAGEGTAAGLESEPQPELRLAREARSAHQRAQTQKVRLHAAVAAHGSREMPVWGDRYRAAESGDNPKMVEQRARAQIDALVKYLETLQEK